MREILCRRKEFDFNELRSNPLLPTVASTSEQSLREQFSPEGVRLVAPTVSSPKPLMILFSYHRLYYPLNICTELRRQGLCFVQYPAARRRFQVDAPQTRYVCPRFSIRGENLVERAFLLFEVWLFLLLVHIHPVLRSFCASPSSTGMLSRRVC